jgi:DNA modification methylase
MPTAVRARTRRPVLDLPPLPAEDYEALKANIAEYGILVPVLLTADGRVIDGNHRRRIAGELGIECPETVMTDLTEEAIRLLARSLNLARRQLTREQRRAVVADQLRETPGRSNRWLARQLGVDHHTVASVRLDLERTGETPQLDRTIGTDGKSRPATRPAVQPAVAAPRHPAPDTVRLIRGDCRTVLPTLPAAGVDLVLTDPPYPEVNREYGRMSEGDWLDLMKVAVRESRRILKPTGSMVVILQPNSERAGLLRTWHLEFALWAAREWNIVQDVYWAPPDAMPVGAVRRTHGLLRPAVKWCVWLGGGDCYRNQDAVLRPAGGRDPRRPVTSDRAGPSGHRRRCGRMDRTAVERGGSTPPNLLSIPVGGGSPGAGDHPAATPLAVAEWWCRYLLPAGGTLLDPFCGSGTTLAAGLTHGAGRVVGVEQEKRYVEIARRRLGG